MAVSGAIEQLNRAPRASVYESGQSAFTLPEPTSSDFIVFDGS
jgi:hypothetical protein